MHWEVDEMSRHISASKAMSLKWKLFASCFLSIIINDSLLFLGFAQTKKVII